MKPSLRIGQTAELRTAVDAPQAIAIGSAAEGTVFSTPAMINLMEYAARAALGSYLDEGEESVGIDVQVEHLSATPLGADVRATARVTDIQDRVISFAIEAFDGAAQIGRGTHRRAVIRTERFVAKVAEKSHLVNKGGVSTVPNVGPLPSFSRIAAKQEGPLLRVTLNRPEKLNAVDSQMTDELCQLVCWLSGHEHEVRVVVITGEGRAFCAGDDVHEVGTLDLDAARELSHRQAQLYLTLERLPQVFIAAINGPALGGGCVMAYSCDLRIASHAGKFGMPEIKLGWPPGYGVAQLTAIVGKAKALELCLLGRIISSHEALAAGLVNEVVASNQLEQRVDQVVEELLALPPLALSATKRLIHTDEGLHTKTAFIADTNAYLRCLETEDAREGIAAFKEKRAGRFRGN